MFTTKMAEKTSVSRSLRTLAQYQLALTSRHGDSDDTLSDFYAQDFALICRQVDTVLKEFLSHTGDSREMLLANNNNSRKEEGCTKPKNSLSSSIASKLRGAVSSVDYKVILETMRTLSSLVKAYSAHKQAQEAARIRQEVKQARQKRRRILRRRNQNGDMEYVEVWEDVSEKGDDRGMDTGKDSVSESNSKAEKERPSKVSEESVANFMAASVALGAGMQAFKYYSETETTEKQIKEVISAREGSEDRVNGDLTNVSPLNTGRVLAEDASNIVKNLQMKGINVPPRLRQTAKETLALVQRMHQVLEGIEDCYKSKVEEERKSLALTAATSICALSYLLSPKTQLLRAVLLYAPFSFTGIYVLNEKYLQWKTWRSSAAVTNCRFQANSLLEKMDELGTERQERKAEISLAAESAIEQRKKITQNVRPRYERNFFPDPPSTPIMRRSPQLAE